MPSANDHAAHRHKKHCSSCPGVFVAEFQINEANMVTAVLLSHVSPGGIITTILLDVSGTKEEMIERWKGKEKELCGS